MKIKYCLHIWFMFMVLQGNAQYMDTLRKIFRGNKSFDFRYEGRWSFVDHRAVGIKSIKLGVTFGRRISAGAGYSWLKSPIKEQFPYFDQDMKKDTLLYRNLKLRYFCYYVDYIFYKSQRWQYSIPMQIGLGRTEFSYSYNDLAIKEPRRFIALYEPAINVKYKIWKWLGLEANVGYRLVLKNNRFLSKTFNSPIYSAGIVVYWSELALSLFPRSAIVQEKLGPSEW